MPPKGAGPSGLSAPPWAAPLMVVATVVITHGYEIFSFRLSLDEAWQAGLGRTAWAEVWVSYGRWAMALVSLALPYALGPVLPVALGVGLSALAWWWLAHGVLRLDPWPSALGVCLAVSAPVYSLIVTFATNIPGVGVGQLAVTAFAWCVLRLTREWSWTHAGGALAAVTIAYGIYESLLVSVALVACLVCACQRRFRTLVPAAALAALGVGLSLLIAAAAQAVTGVRPNHYASVYFTPDAVHRPVTATIVAVTDTGRTLLVSVGMFGVDAYWVYALALGLLVVAGLRLARRSGPPGAFVCVAVTGLCAAIVLAAALVTESLPLRTQVYLPLLWILVVLVAFGHRADDRPDDSPGPTRGTAGRLAIGTLGVLAVLSQAAVANAVYQSGAVTAARDTDIALQIDRQRVAVAGDRALPVVVAGAVDFGQSPVAPEVETSGFSLFRTTPRQVAMYLQTQGVKVLVPSRTQVQQGKRQLDRMPVYPTAGWVQVRRGLLLVSLPRSAD